MIRDVVELADALAEGLLIRWRLRATSAAWWLSDRCHDLGVALASGIPGVVTPLKVYRSEPWPYDGDEPLPEWEAELLGHPWSPWKGDGLLSRRRYELELD